MSILWYLSRALKTERFDVLTKCKWQIKMCSKKFQKKECVQERESHVVEELVMPVVISFCCKLNHVLKNKDLCAIFANNFFRFC